MFGLRYCISFVQLADSTETISFYKMNKFLVYLFFFLSQIRAKLFISYFSDQNEADEVWNSHSENKPLMKHKPAVICPW